MKLQKPPHRTWSEQVGIWSSNATLLFLSAAVIVGIIASFMPLSPFSKLEISIANTPRVGGEIVVTVDYCKSWNASPVKVQWFLVNTVTVQLEGGMVTLPSGCGQRNVFVPVSHVAPGRYLLRLEDKYLPLPWRPIVVTAESAEFLLLPVGNNRNDLD